MRARSCGSTSLGSRFTFLRRVINSSYSGSCSSGCLSSMGFIAASPLLSDGRSPVTVEAYANTFAVQPPRISRTDRQCRKSGDSCYGATILALAAEMKVVRVRDRDAHSSPVVPHIAPVLAPYLLLHWPVLVGPALREHSVDGDRPLYFVPHAATSPFGGQQVDERVLRF